jgi:hypothetical protein
MKEKFSYYTAVVLLILLNNFLFAKNGKFYVVSTEPQDGQQNVEFNTNIIIKVNNPLLRKSLIPQNIYVNNLPLSQSYPEISRIPQIDNYTFVIPIMLEYGKTYTIHLSSSIMDDYNNNLQPYTFKFSVVNKEPFKILSTEYSVEENHVVATIKFNRKILCLPTDISVFYKDTPIENFEMQNIIDPVDEIKIKIPVSEIENNIEYYKIKISTTIVSVYGEHLKKPYIWKLKKKQ